MAGCCLRLLFAGLQLTAITGALLCFGSNCSKIKAQLKVVGNGTNRLIMIIIRIIIIIFQRISVLIQRFNSVLLRETFPVEDDTDT